MGWLSSFLHPERGYEKGQKELERYFQQAQGFQQPYNQYGQEASGDLFSAMRSLLNPEELQNKWSSGYELSPYAKQTQEMAAQNGLDSASSMHMLGSTPALQALQAGKTQIGIADRDNYMSQLMDKYKSGLGIAGNVFNTGANTAANMGGNAMTMGNNSAEMAYNKANAPGSMLSNLLGIGGSLGAGYLAGRNNNSRPWNFTGAR